MPTIREKLRSVNQFKDSGKVVFVRADYNVPVKEGIVVDDSRIVASLPTLEYLGALSSRIVIGSHLGRPTAVDDTTLTLRPVAERLAELLRRKFIEVDPTEPRFPDYPVPHVLFLSTHGSTLSRELLAQQMQAGDILVLENLRFNAGEDSASDSFAASLANLADIYVNEAFSFSHRRTASMTKLPRLLPSFAGLELMDELHNLDFVLTTERRPLVLVIGGAKMKDKAAMLSQLVPKADHLLLGGAMANLFLKASGYEVGDSLVDEEGLLTAREMLRNYKDKILLPDDVVVARSGSDEPGVVDSRSVRSHERIMDIGPAAIRHYSEVIKTADIIVWNGPLGVFEQKRFSHGTLALARLIASRAGGAAYALAGGGETIAALDQTQMRGDLDYTSMAGGAMLNYLGGTSMPGLDALI